MKQNGTTDHPGRTAVDAMMERMVNALGGKAAVQTVYGDPVGRGGVTVIPVAKSRWGFGGGGGEGDEGQGMGGGGGATAKPVGYIEIVDGRARFVRIHDQVAMMLAGAALVLALSLGAGWFRRGRR